MAWDIAFRHKYRHDIFFSTRVKIILCLTFFVLLILISIVVLLEQVKKTLIGGMVESLTMAVTTGVSDPGIIQTASQNVQFATYTTITLLLLFALLAGLLVSRLALTPLSKAFQMQKHFISGVAHELRTPLSLLRINNELARFTVDKEAQFAGLFEENIADIDKIDEMLNNLLLFDRMTSSPSVRFDDVDLRELIRIVVERLSPFARQRSVTVFVTDATIPKVIANITALEQVFFNIIKNAIAYTNPNGEVTIAYRGKDAHSVTIGITDTGVGIPAKDLPHIFEPFYRTEKTGKLSGTGMGLAIVYEIMKFHKGTVEVESVVNTGTSVNLTLPLAQSETEDGRRE